MPLDPTNRRTVIAALGSAAAWPLVARGQQEKVWRVGYLSPGFSNVTATSALFDEFRLKLRELGYVEGKNLTIDVKRAEGDYTRLSALAYELVSSGPDVLVGTASPAIAALQRATSTIPIVMAAGGDPIGLGFVKSLSNPGGNITGLSNLSAETTAKSLELLRVAFPKAKRIAMLTSPAPLHEILVKEAYAAGGETLGLAIVPVLARAPADLQHAFANIRKENCDALLVLSDARVNRQVVDLANEARLPAMYQVTGFVEMGGLISYSADLREMFQQPNQPTCRCSR
jgi:putative ABC transport system substrate-binding protein